MDQNKVSNLSSPNASIGDPDTIYQRYLKAFKKGVFNYIKETPVFPPLDGEGKGGGKIPRKYFSGGFDAQKIVPRVDFAQSINPAEISIDLTRSKDFLKISVNLDCAQAAQPDKKNFKVKFISTTPISEMIANLRIRMTAPIKNGSNWVRITATPQQAWDFYTNWRSSKEGFYTAKFQDKEYRFPISVWEKMTAWFKESPNFERKGYFIVQKSKSEIEQIIDFVPVSTVALDPTVAQFEYDEKTTQSLMDSGWFFTKPEMAKEFGIDLEAYQRLNFVIQNANNPELGSIPVHSHHVTSNYSDGPSQQDHKIGSDDSVEMVYVIKNETAYLYNKSPQVVKIDAKANSSNAMNSEKPIKRSNFLSVDLKELKVKRVLQQGGSGAKVFELEDTKGELYYLKFDTTLKELHREYFNYHVAELIGVNIPKVVLLNKESFSQINGLPNQDNEYGILVQSAQEVSFDDLNQKETSGIEELIVFAHLVHNIDWDFLQGANLSIRKYPQTGELNHYIEFDLETDINEESKRLLRYDLHGERIAAKYAYSRIKEIDAERLKKIIDRVMRLDMQQFTRLLEGIPEDDVGLKYYPARQKSLKEDIIYGLEFVARTGSANTREIRKLVEVIKDHSPIAQPSPAMNALNPLKEATIEKGFANIVSTILSETSLTGYGSDLSRLTENNWESLRNALMHQLARQEGDEIFRESIDAFIRPVPMDEFFKAKGHLSAQDLVEILQRLHTYSLTLYKRGLRKETIFKSLVWFMDNSLFSYASIRDILEKAGLQGELWDKTLPDVRMLQYLHQRSFFQAHELYVHAARPQQMALLKAIMEYFKVPLLEGYETILFSAIRRSRNNDEAAREFLPSLGGDMQILLFTAEMLRRMSETKDLKIEGVLGRGADGIAVKVRGNHGVEVVKINMINTRDRSKPDLKQRRDLLDKVWSMPGIVRNNGLLLMHFSPGFDLILEINDFVPGTNILNFFEESIRSANYVEFFDLLHRYVNISRELYQRKYVNRDVNNLSNVLYSSTNGAVLVDLGNIYPYDPSRDSIYRNELARTLVRLMVGQTYIGEGQINIAEVRELFDTSGMKNDQRAIRLLNVIEHSGLMTFAEFMDAVNKAMINQSAPASPAMNIVGKQELDSFNSLRRNDDGRVKQSKATLILSASIKKARRLLNFFRSRDSAQLSLYFENNVFVSGNKKLTSSGPGGIDLTPKRMNLEVQKDKAQVSQSMDLTALDNIEIDGLYIKDIEIKPMKNLPELLGVQAN